MVTADSHPVRERIMDVATGLFVSQGYDGISMREIAEAAGVSKAGLYYHFEDKEQLFVEILRENLERLEQAILAAHRLGTAREQIGQVVRAIMERAPEQRAIIRLASQEMARVSTQAREEFYNLYQAKFVGQIEAAIQRGIDTGELRPIDARSTAWLLLGMMYPFLYPSGGGDPSRREDATGLLLQVFFDGAASTPAPGSTL